MSDSRWWNEEQNSPVEPTFDMDGGYYHGEPTPEDVAAYAAQQEQAMEWAKAGKCQDCGADDPTPIGMCVKCMDAMIEDRRCGCGGHSAHSHDGRWCCGGMMCCNRANV